MTLRIKVYGFGSAFARTDAATKVASDVDLLIVHQNTAPASCELAIKCKRRLIETVPHAHVTMLSEGEENLLQFTQTANVTPIGTVRARLFHDDFKLLCKGLAFIAGGKNFAKNAPSDSGEEAQSSKHPDAGI